MKNLLKKLKSIIPPQWIAMPFIVVFWLVTRLNLKWQFRIGRLIGRTIQLFPSKLTRTTEINIKHCFPELSDAERKTLISKNFESLGLGVMECAMSMLLPWKENDGLFKINGLEHGKAAQAKGKGILLVGPHFTSIEMVGRMIPKGYPLVVVYRPHKKKQITYIQEKFRRHHYAHYISRDKVRDIVRALQNNMAVWYAYDVDAGSKRSVFAPFFGIQTATLTSVSRLVQLTGATVIPVSYYRHDDEFRYEMNLLPPFDHFPSDDPVKDAAMINAELEKAIRQKPEQYIWQYKRFKTRPPGEKSFY